MAGLHPDNHLIGVDIGGTNTIVAVVSLSGEVLARSQMRTLPSLGPTSGLERIAALIESVYQEVNGENIAGIGVGCTGPIDRITGRVFNPHTLPTWDGFSVTEGLSARFNVPAVMENDAHAGALGEHWQGAGRGSRHMIYVTVGTGIGAGLILEGSLYTGAEGTAGEIGHIIVDETGPPCYCGLNGCVESIAAAPALINQAREHIQQATNAILTLSNNDPKQISPETIAEAARNGDYVAHAIIAKSARALGIALRDLVVTLSPQIIVLGGGVMKSFDLFEPGIQEVLRTLHLPISNLRIVPAQLGRHAGVIGAARAYLVRGNSQKQAI